MTKATQFILAEDELCSDADVEKSLEKLLKNETILGYITIVRVGVPDVNDMEKVQIFSVGNSNEEIKDMLEVATQYLPSPQKIPEIANSR